MYRIFLTAFTWLGVGLLAVFVLFASIYLVSETFGFQTSLALGLKKDDLVLIGINILAFIFIPIFIQERADRKRELSDRKGELAEILTLARSREGALVSIGTKQTFEDVLRIVRTARFKIEVIVSGGPKASEEWLGELRDHLVNMRRLGTPITYDVLVHTPVEIARSANFQDGVRSRDAAFKRDGIKYRVQVIETNRLFGLNALIIDSKHVCIGISPSVQTDISMAISLENHDQVGQAFSSWFHRLAKEATSLVS